MKFRNSEISKSEIEKFIKFYEFQMEELVIEIVINCISNKLKIVDLQNLCLLSKKTKFSCYSIPEVRYRLFIYKNKGKDVDFLVQKEKDKLLVDSCSKFTNTDFGFIKFLIDRGANVNVHQGLLLNFSVKYGKFDLVKFLITNKADANVKFEEGGLLSLAFMSGKFDLVKYVIEEIGLVTTTHDINRYLMNSCYSFSYSFKIEYLIEKGKDIDLSSILITAVLKNQMDLVEYLVNKGTKIDNKCLSWASYNGNFEMVKYLVKHGVNPDNRDAIRYASEKGFSDILRFLKSKM